MENGDTESLICDLSSPNHKTYSIMCVQSLTEAGGISYDVIDNSAFNAEAYNLLFNNFRAT